MTSDRIAASGQHLGREERSPGTVEKYLRDVRAFAAWLEGRAVPTAGWKEHLSKTGRAPVTVNSMLAAVNARNYI